MLIKKNTDVEKKTSDVNIEKPAYNGRLSIELCDLLIRQLQHELQNHNLYMEFSNFYANKGLSLLEEYYQQRAQEEYTHHSWIRKFLNENDVTYKYPEIKTTSYTYKELIDPLEITIEVEEDTTEMIYEIVECASKNKDYITLAWLNSTNSDTGMLVLEQMEELSLSKTAFDIANNSEDWLLIEKAILDLYTK